MCKLLYGKSIRLTAKNKKCRSFPENRFRDYAERDEAPIQSDVLGSYTGIPEDEKDKPIQDSDDL